MFSVGNWILHVIRPPFQVLFARAEALHTHGHTQYACKLAVKLAEEMLENPPNLIADLMTQPTKGKRSKRQVVVNTASHQMSCLATATLAKAAFLCTVLSENNEHHHLAFKVGMFVLEMPRPPASTKALEVSFRFFANVVEHRQVFQRFRCVFHAGEVSESGVRLGRSSEEDSAGTGRAEGG